MALTGCILAIFGLSASDAAAASNPIKTFIDRIGGDDLGDVNNTAADLARFDMILCIRGHYNDLGGDSWAALRAINPDIKIFLYQFGDGDGPSQDSYARSARNIPARWNVTDGLTTKVADHPEWILKDDLGAEIYHADNNTIRLMDVGLDSYRDFWLEATKLDITEAPTGIAADGVFIDHCFVTLITAHASVNYPYPPGAAVVDLYRTDADWAAAQTGFISAIATGLAPKGVITNSGPMSTIAAYNTWIAMDSAAVRPYGMMVEDGFTAASGVGDTYCMLETQWKYRVDLLKNISNFRVLMQSRTKLVKGTTGTDQYGEPMSYYEAFWYSLGSYWLGRNNSQMGHFYFLRSSDYNQNDGYWEDEYSKIDLGLALGDYQLTNFDVGGGVIAHIYSREFEKGFVYVNPHRDATHVPLPSGNTLRLLTHETINDAPQSLPIVTEIDLKRFRSAIVLKSESVTSGTPTASHTPTASPTEVLTLTGTPTPIPGQGPGPQIVAYPNPVVTELSIAISDPGLESVRLVVFNVTGEPVAVLERRDPGTLLTWDLGRLAPGLYFYQATWKKDGRTLNGPVQKLAKK